MLKFLTALFSLGKALLALLPSTDRKLGRAETENKSQAQVIHDQQEAATISDNIDNMSDTDADKLCDRLNSRS